MTQSGVLYLLDEWRHDPARTSVRLSDTQLSAGFRGFAQQRHTPQPVEPRLERTYVDPAAASLKVQLYADQFEGLVDADNDVAYGIRTVASLLTTGRLLVSDRCPGFIEEVSGYSLGRRRDSAGERRAGEGRRPLPGRGPVRHRIDRAHLA
jgi:hypothetical protein